MYRPMPTIVSVIALSAIAFAAPALSQGQGQQPRPDAPQQRQSGGADKGPATTTTPSTARAGPAESKDSDPGPRSAGGGGNRPEASERSQDKDGGQRRGAGENAEQRPKAAGSGASEDGTRKGRQGDSGTKSTDDRKSRQSDSGPSTSTDDRKARQSDGGAKSTDDSRQGRQQKDGQAGRSGAAEKSNDPAAGTAEGSRTPGRAERPQRDATGSKEAPQGGASAGTQSESRAATTGPRLTEQQRTSVRQAIVRTQPQRVRVNIDVRVGAEVPRSVELRTLPVDLITIVPAYRDYRYVVVEDRIAIVDPVTFSVVEVIEYRERSAGASGSQPNPPLVLSGADRQFIHRTVMREHDGRKHQIRAALGAEVPRSIELERFPERVTERLPVLDDYRYVVSGNSVLIVEPGDNEVVVVVED